MTEWVAIAAKAITVLCGIGMALIVASAFLKGRGMESVWPADGHPEPPSADIPSSSLCEKSSVGG